MYGTYQRLNVSIYASDREVIRAASRKIAKSNRFGKLHRAERKAFYRRILGYHASARELAREWRM